VNAATSAPPQGGQNITVGVRVRKFHADEPKDLAVRMREATCEIHVQHRGRFPFSFDECFWSNDVEDTDKEYSSQEAVFEKLGRPLVENALAGFNSSIIAYGQTGSGKTYSIFGPPGSLGTQEEGLIPRVCKSILQSLHVPTPGTQHKVFVSILEIYLEDVFDLLQRRKELKVRGDSSGFSVVGLKSVQVQEYSEVEKLICQAESQKTFAATAIHDRSSRAHTIFQLELRSITNNTTRTAKVVLADLAGSERIKAAQTDTGVGFEQARNINLSLLNLGTCIEAVVNRCKAGQPTHNIGEFRNSTLTKLLKDFIGGNSRTAMLVTIAPSMGDVNNSLQSLRFADRAKQITNHAVINTEVNSDGHLMKEQIAKMYEKKRELLDKECELEMQQSMIKKKHADLEKLSFELMEERRRLREETDRLSSDEKLRRQRRESEIELRLKSLQKELAEAETQRDALDEKYLEMVREQQATMQDKEQLSQDYARLVEEFDHYKTETTQQSLLKEMEHAQAIAHLEDRLKEVSGTLEEMKVSHKAKLDQIAMENNRKFALVSSEHCAAIQDAQDKAKEIETLRKKVISLEEDLAESSSELEAKTKQSEVLAMAHTKSAARIATLDEQISELNISKAAAARREEELRHQVQDLSDALKRKEKEHVDTVTVLTVDRKQLEDELRNTILSLNEEIGTLIADHKKKVSTLEAQLEVERNDATKKLDAATRQQETLRADLTAAEQQLNQRNSKLNSAQQSNVELELQCREIMNELTETTQLLQLKENEVTNLEDRLSTAAEQNRELEKKCSELSHAYAECRERLAAEESSHAATRRKLGATIASLDESEAQLNAVTAKLRQDLATEQQAAQTYRKKLLATRNTNDVILQQCVAAQNALAVALQQRQQEMDHDLSMEVPASANCGSVSHTPRGASACHVDAASHAHDWKLPAHSSLSKHSLSPKSLPRPPLERNIERENMSPSGSPPSSPSRTIGFVG
jgi:hypothetical protein